MPDHNLEESRSGPYDPGLEARVSRLEDRMVDISATLSELRASTGRLEAGFARLEAGFDRLTTGCSRVETGLTVLEARFDATIPHLATKEQIAMLPTKIYMWGVLGVLVTCILGTFAAVLAAISVLH